MGPPRVGRPSVSTRPAFASDPIPTSVSRLVAATGPPVRVDHHEGDRSRLSAHASSAAPRRPTGAVRGRRAPCPGRPARRPGPQLRGPHRRERRGRPCTARAGPRRLRGDHLRHAHAGDVRLGLPRPGPAHLPQRRAHAADRLLRRRRRHPCGQRRPALSLPDQAVPARRAAARVRGGPRPASRARGRARAARADPARRHQGADRRPCAHQPRRLRPRDAPEDGRGPAGPADRDDRRVGGRDRGAAAPARCRHPFRRDRREALLRRGAEPRGAEDGRRRTARDRADHRPHPAHGGRPAGPQGRHAPLRRRR